MLIKHIPVSIPEWVVTRKVTSVTILIQLLKKKKKPYIKTHKNYVRSWGIRLKVLFIP